MSDHEEKTLPVRKLWDLNLGLLVHSQILCNQVNRDEVRTVDNTQSVIT